MNELRYNEISIGFTQSFTRTVESEMESAFRQISGDENPLHRNDEFARKIGRGKFSGHVAYGMLTASLYSTLAGVYIPGKYSLIHSLDKLSFFRPVYVGDRLTVTGEVTEKNDALKMLFVKGKITNQNGKKVSSAEIKVYVLK